MVYNTVNLYDEITNLFKIYESINNKEFDLEKSFHNQKFLNYIFPELKTL